MIDLTIHPEALERNVEVARKNHIILPTFEQMKHPELIPDKVKEALKNVGLWDVNPLNLFRITWHNEPVMNGGQFGGVNYIELPSSLTGVKARIFCLIGKWFPTGCHKVGASYGCLVPRLVTGQFDATYNKAVWPSTGNYCRGGAFNSKLLACESVAILPAEMSKERFDWLSKIAGEVTKVEEQEDHSWIVEVSNDKESIAHKCGISSTIRAWVKVGAEVRAGAKLTEGNVDPKELLSIAGVQAVQNYILKEVKKVYAVTGIDISDKHVEVIIKQMLKKVIVVEPGGSELCAGQTISLKKINDLNTELLLSGKQPAKFEPLLLGISKSSVETDSFLSAASFQETTKVLTDAAVNGKVDNLFGIKENVIIGKLIPAGTGSKFERETTKLVLERAEELDEIREEKLLAAQEEASLPSEMLGEYDEDADIDANEAEETVDEQEEAE